MSAQDSLPKPIAIDIQPGTSLNTINPKTKSNIPVAILSTTDFYPLTQVDLKSLTFGRTGDEQSLGSCHAAEDFNMDGVQDLLCLFYTGKADFHCGDTKGILKGETKDRTPIEGNDSVKIVPCK